MLSASIQNSEAECLAKTAKMLHLPQKTLATALHAFFVAKSAIKIEPDDIVLQCACICLACRMCETHRPAEHILDCASHQHAVEIPAELKAMYMECISKTEVDVCITLDFELEAPDFYGHLESICKSHGLDTNYSRRCWIFLNDILMRPVSVFFTVPEIVYSCLLTEYVARKYNDGNGEESMEEGQIADNRHIIQAFADWLNIEAADACVLEFILSEILSIYEPTK